MNPRSSPLEIWNSDRDAQFYFHGSSTITTDVYSASKLTINALKALQKQPLNGSKPATTLQLLYEDTQTGLRARQICERIVDCFDLEADFHVRLFRFDLLEDPLLFEVVLKEAQTAVVLLLAAHGSTHLPETVFAWVRRWMASNDNDEPRAMVVFLESASKGSAQGEELLARLEGVARMFDVDIFPVLGQLPPVVWQAPVDSASMTVPAKLVRLDDARYQPGDWENRFWGINE
jgi:hypothetical protein